MCNKYSKPEPHIGKNDKGYRQNQADQSALEVAIKFTVQHGECLAAIVMYEHNYCRSDQKVERKPDPLPHGLAVHICPSPMGHPIHNALRNNRASRGNKLSVKRSASGSGSVGKFFDFVIECFCLSHCIASEKETFC